MNGSPTEPDGDRFVRRDDARRDRGRQFAPAVLFAFAHLG